MSSFPVVGLPPPLTQHKPIELYFDGGMNDSQSDELIKDNELSAVENFIPDLLNAGVIIKREGLTRTSTLMTEAITSVHSGANANYFTTSTTIRAFAGTSLASALASTTDPDWATFLNNDVMVNGTTAPQTSTNGTTFAALGGTPPIFKYIEVYNQTLWGAGHNTGTLRWADFGTVATWTSTNGLTISNQENDNIIGLRRYNDKLVVFTRFNFHHVKGFNTPDVRITYSGYGIGCTSHRSIVSTPFGLFWWTDVGIAKTQTGFLDDTFDLPSMRKIPSFLNGLNKNNYSLVHGCWNPRKHRVEFYVFNGSGQSTVNAAIYYYYASDTFWIQTGLGAQIGACGNAVVSGQANVYVGSAATSQYLWLSDETVNLDDTVQITSTLRTKRVFGEYGPMSLKRLRSWSLLTAQTGPGTVSYNIFLNNSIGTPDVTSALTLSGLSGFILDTSVLDTGVLGADVAPAELTSVLNRRYRKIQWGLVDSNSARTRYRGIIGKGFLAHL